MKCMIWLICFVLLFTEPNNNCSKDLNRNEQHDGCETATVGHSNGISADIPTAISYEPNKIEKSIRSLSTSRLTSKMARLVQSDRKIRVDYVDNKIVYVCFFCECKSSKTIDEWLRHITDHTDESYDECEVKENGSPVSGYICKGCNYVQLEKSRLIQHLRVQHRTSTNNYKKIVLVPRKPKPTKQTVHVQVHVHHHHRLIQSNADGLSLLQI